MSRIYWLPVIAAFGLILAGSVHADPVSHGGSNHRSATQTTSKPKADSQPAARVAIQNDVQRIASALEAANAKQPSDDDKKLAKDNLDAQKNMAFWAKWMFRAACAETIVTLLGVFLVWRTLRASWAAAKEAKRAADAANESVKETRRIGEAQVRAYVTWHPQKITVMRNESGGLGGNSAIIMGCLTINRGQTPANNVRIDFNILCVPAPVHFNGFDKTELIVGTSSSGAIGGGGGDQFHTLQKPLILNVAQIQAGRETILICGKVYYQDIWERSQETEFVGEITGLAAWITEFTRTKLEPQSQLEFRWLRSEEKSN